MKRKRAQSRYSYRLFAVAVLTVAAGISISLDVRNRVIRAESVRARLTAETILRNTGQELALFAEVLESVCALHALSDAVDQAAMDEFIEKGLVYQHRVLGSFGLAQRIDPWLRADIETKDPNRPGAYHIVQSGPDNTWIPAENKPVYYPLTWQSRAGGLNIPVGFDFSSIGSEALHTIQQIEQTRRPALVPVPDTFSKDSGAAYWVFAPVIPRPLKEQILYFPPDTVIGFSVAVLRPDTLLQRVAALAGSSQDIRLNLSIGTGDGEKIRKVSGRWLYSSPLEAIGVSWIFDCSMPVSVTGNRSTAAFAAGLIMTSLVGSLFLLLAGQTRKIEATVHLRTEALRIANTRLEETIQERARLEEEMNELAARERRKIGRDLHDSLGQKLTGAVFLSRSLLDYFTGKDSGQRQHALTLNETLKDAVAQVRSTARGLDPVSLSSENLAEALRQLTEEMTGLYGVSCELAECADVSGLARKTKDQLYLIAREAVNNAARHAQAGRITIRLTGGTTGWKLRIEDNGRGLPETPPAGKGMGIRIMRHRAGLIGAQFTIFSVPDKGTAVEIASK